MANENTSNEDGARAQLAALGWEGPDVEKVLRGPAYHSLREIVGVQTDGWEVEQGADDSQLLPHASGSGSAEGMSQKELTGAVWTLLHGDPTKFLAVSSGISELPGECQAYLLAAMEAVLSPLDYLRDWSIEFKRQHDERTANKRNSETRREHIAVAVLEAAAKAEKKIPVVGQSLAFFLRLGIEIRAALLWTLPPPLILAARLVERVEGEGGVVAGLDATAEEVQMDAVAALLKAPEAGTRYPFVPSLAMFKREAERLMLYPHQPNAIQPVRESYTWIIGLKSAVDVQPGYLRMTLQGNAMGLAELELAGVETDETKRLLTGTIAVGDSLGSIESGTLRLRDDAAAKAIGVPRPAIEYVGIVSGRDGAKWRATGIGEPDRTGRYRLLRFETYEGDFEPPAVEGTDAGDDADGDEAGQTGDESSHTQAPGSDDGDADSQPSGVKTIEIFGMLVGLKVPLALVYRPGVGVLPGAKVLIADSPGEGFGYAGQPGRWKEVYGDKTPEEFGLPANLAVVVFDGKRAWPVRSSYLAMLYGDKWQSVIVGE